MTAKKIVETVKETVATAKGKAGMIGAHGKDVIGVGAQTLQAAKEVVVEAGRQASGVLSNTRDELKRTLKEGASQIGEKLANIASPTRKEEAVAHKQEIQAKKQRKRAEQRESEMTEA
ncbi:MAG TPA: hypothetical protein VM074_05790 [Solimonas sp.]|nr:hypothetical protein [Solimonas sp.]